MDSNDPPSRGAPRAPARPGGRRGCHRTVSVSQAVIASVTRDCRRRGGGRGGGQSEI